MKASEDLVRYALLEAANGFPLSRDELRRASDPIGPHRTWARPDVLELAGRIIVGAPTAFGPVMFSAVNRVVEDLAE